MAQQKMIFVQSTSLTHKLLVPETRTSWSMLRHRANLTHACCKVFICESYMTLMLSIHSRVLSSLALHSETLFYFKKLSLAPIFYCLVLEEVPFALSSRSGLGVKFKIYPLINGWCSSKSVIKVFLRDVCCLKLVNLFMLCWRRLIMRLEVKVFKIRWSWGLD